METTDKKGPIYSRSPLDRPGNRNSVIDYADHGRSREEMEFILSHKIAPGIQDPADQQAASLSSFQGSTPESAGTARPSLQRPATGQWGSAWVPRSSRRKQQTPAQQRAAMIAILVWLLFILLSILMSIFGGR